MLQYRAPKQGSGAHSQGHRKDDTHISSAFSKGQEKKRQQQEQTKPVTFACLTQAVVVVFSSLIPRGSMALGRYLADTVFSPTLFLTVRATGKLNLSAWTLAETFNYGIKAPVATAIVALLCHLQGTSLKQLMRLDFSNPGQVLGRAGLTAAATLAAKAIAWKFLDTSQ
jgi:hypothetical protein